MTGEYFINGKDAYTEYGISLSDGALSTLMTYPSMKENVKNKSRLQHGARVVVDNPKYDERSINLPFHITASSKTDFFTKYGKFCDDVLSTGKINISTIFQPTKEYKLIYESCQQFTEYEQEMAMFVLRCTEIDPTDRTLDENSSLL